MSSSNNTMESRDFMSTASGSVQHEEEEDDHLKAVEILTKKIKFEPENYFLYFERSICHYKLGDFKASLDDANQALRLNKSDHHIHNQKGLALVGLSRRAEAVASFKKSIALLAMREDSKLSEIFNLLKFASSELRAGKPSGTSIGQTTTVIPNNYDEKSAATNQGTSGNNPVDSTTDRPSNHQAGLSADPKRSVASIASIMKTGSNSLVATNCNSTNNFNNARPAVNGTKGFGICNDNLYVNTMASGANNLNNNKPMINGRVTSSAGLATEHPTVPPVNFNLGIPGSHTNVPTFGHELIRIPQQTNPNASDSAMLEWNIRRSERIFLHHSSDTTTPVNQFGLLKSNEHQSLSVSPKPKSNPLIVTNNRTASKRPRDASNDPPTHVSVKIDDQSQVDESDVDVDDSYSDSKQTINTGKPEDQSLVVMASSSSVTATGQQGSANSKEDSYSSRYKRLRRDRERARRGTSKLCTIKINDLEELQKPVQSGKRFMRVIAPINGWLYSGQLSVNEGSNPPQYVVDLDEAVNGSSSYLFTQLAVLTDVIKEVRIKSVADLRKGARICCYWKRQKKCLSTGVVTSRTFEATKALVSVKYDNGDLSALPLDDLRLLPPDYPKYMSNPELLDRDGGTGTAGVVSGHVASTYPAVVYDNSSKVTIERKLSSSDLTKKVDITRVGSKDNLIISDAPPPQQVLSKEPEDFTESSQSNDLVVDEMDDQPSDGKDDFERDNHNDSGFDERRDHQEQQQQQQQQLEQQQQQQDQLQQQQQISTIPPTNEVIDFLTSENNFRPKSAQDEQPQSERTPESEETRSPSIEVAETIEPSEKELTIVSPNTEEVQMMSGSDGYSLMDDSGAFGIEYRPWVFDGPPKRTKRHGRTYRDNYSRIRRGSEVIRVGDSAELMPRDESILPFIAKIEGLWATNRGEMRVKVRWYYRLIETEGEPYKLRDGENALFETDHCDENDVQSIYRSTQILPWADYSKVNLGHVNASADSTPKIFYLAGYYDPVRRIKHLRPDVRDANLASV